MVTFSIDYPHTSGRIMTLTSVASILSPRDNSILFIGRKSIHLLDNIDTVSDCLIFTLTDIDIRNEFRSKHMIVQVENPRKEFGKFLEENNLEVLPQTTYECIDGAIISCDSTIGDNVKLGPFAFVDRDVEIGDNCIIHSGVKLLPRTKIGANTEIHENVVVGTTALAYEDNQRIPQLGGIDIGNNVTIGANTVICRGAIENTIIMDNCVIDTLCNISHNNVIGENSMIVAGALTFGSVRIGENSYVSGQTVIKNGVTIGSRAVVGMGSVVTQNIPDGQTVFGNPARILRSPAS